MDPFGGEVVVKTPRDASGAAGQYPVISRCSWTSDAVLGPREACVQVQQRWDLHHGSLLGLTLPWP